MWRGFWWERLSSPKPDSKSLSRKLNAPPSPDFKLNPLRPAAQVAITQMLSVTLSRTDEAFPGPDKPRGTQGNAQAGPSGECQSSPEFLSPSMFPELLPSQAERGAPEPEALAADIDFTPETPRLEPESLLLEIRGVTSQGQQSVMWEREIVFRESILAKLRSISKVHLAGKMAECHTVVSVKKCNGCRKTTKFFNRCELFFCPICAPRLSRERRQSIEWWAKQISQPKHLVLTVRNTSDLTTEYVRFLKTQLAKLRRAKVFRSVKGGFYSMEVTNEGRGWHVHFHLLIDTPWLCMPDVSETWGKLVGQDFAICKIKDCRGKEYLQEVTKYAVKGSELARWSPRDIATFIDTFDGVRFFGVFGTLYGKRTEWRDWIKQLQEIKPLCACGCNSWRILSPEELLWEEETRSGLSAQPPPTRTQVPSSQADLALDGTRSFVWPD